MRQALGMGSAMGFRKKTGTPPLREGLGVYHRILYGDGSTLVDVDYLRRGVARGVRSLVLLGSEMPLPGVGPSFLAFSNLRRHHDSFTED